MNNSLDATNVAFSKMEGDESYQFEKIKVEVQNLIIELGQKLIPVVRDDLLPLFKDTLIPVAQKLAEKIGELSTWFNNLSTEVKNSSLAFIGLVAVVGPAALALSTMVTGVTRTAAAIKGMAVAWKLLNATMLFSPVGIIATLTTLFAGLTVAAYKKEKADKAAYEAAIKHSEALKKSATESLKLTTQTNNLLSSYSKLASKTNLTAIEQEKLRDISQKLKELLPDLNIIYDNQGRILKDNLPHIENYITAEEDKAIAHSNTAIAILSEQIALKKLSLERMNNMHFNGSGRIDYSGDMAKEADEIANLNSELNEHNSLLNNLYQNQRSRKLLAKNDNDNKENTNNKPSSSGGSPPPPKSPEPPKLLLFLIKYLPTIFRTWKKN